MIDSHVVSFDLSRRLHELGINKKSIFCWSAGETLSEKLFNLGELKYDVYIYDDEIEKYDYIPAYTASELLEMLPKEIMSVDYEPKDEDAEYGKLILEKCFDGDYEIGYYCSKTGEDVLFLGYQITKDKFPQNALAKMLIYLIENNLVDVKDINR